MKKNKDIEAEDITEEEVLDESTDNSPEVAQELSQVATNPKQSAIILIAAVAIFAYLFFNFVINSDDNKKEKVEIPDNVIMPVQNTEIEVPTIPTLPSPPKLDDLTPPPPMLQNETENPQSSLPDLPQDVALPSDSPLVNLPTAKIKDDRDLKRQEKKRKSTMILVSGEPPSKTQEELQQAADFRYRGDMNLMLGRGKIINAVIESALNTDFGGEVRALINKDTYSEWGKNILIPKGSRVFGTYSTDIDGPYGRINVIWNRIDLANGFSINLNGSTIDGLGRSGQQGRVDNKLKERLGNAVLRSAFNILLANTLDKVVTPQINSEASAKRNLEATSVKNIANTIFANTALNEADRRVQICADVLNHISDPTSSTYTQIQTVCNNLAADPVPTDPDKLISLMNSINTITDGLIQDTNSKVEETQAQSASKESYNDISETLKSFVEEQDMKPTITVEQGTLIRIYVNKDYVFPKKAVSKMRVY